MESKNTKFKNSRMKQDWRQRHLKHQVEIIHGHFGPHRAKLICKDCRGKFLSWLPRNFKDNTV